MLMNRRLITFRSSVMRHLPCASRPLEFYSCVPEGQSRRLRDVCDGREATRVSPRYIPGDAGPALVSAHPPGDGWSQDTDRVPDASHITPPVRHPSEGLANPVSLVIHLDTGFPTEDIV